jgi:hypothetical protein
MKRSKDAEIERLLLKHAKEQNVLLTSLEAATKEIERLRVQVKELSEVYQKAIGPIRPAERDAEIERSRALITELADALRHRLDYRLTDEQESDDRKLLARICDSEGRPYSDVSFQQCSCAREATR